MFYNSNEKTLTDLYPHGSEFESCEICDYQFDSAYPRPANSLPMKSIKTNFIHYGEERIYSTLVNVCKYHWHREGLIEEYTGQIFGGYDGWSGHNWVYQPIHLGEAMRLVLNEPCCISSKDWNPPRRIEDQADLDFFLP